MTKKESGKADASMSHSYSSVNHFFIPKRNNGKEWITRREKLPADNIKAQHSGQENIFLLLFYDRNRDRFR